LSFILDYQRAGDLEQAGWEHAKLDHGLCSALEFLSHEVNPPPFRRMTFRVITPPKPTREAAALTDV